MTTKKETGAKVDLGLLEEDDEFEEFPADGEWAVKWLELYCMQSNRVWHFEDVIFLKRNADVIQI